MEISISEAEGHLAELIRRAEGGEPVILTREGRPAAQISALRPKLSMEEKRRRMDAFWAAMASKVDTGGESAARGEDFLYDEFGLPK